jgi:broad specificity phosphatase PhoE
MRKSTIVLIVILSQLLSFGLLGLAGTQAADETVFFVVRHADKLNETDDNPPLSEAGKKRAQQLRDALKNLRVDAIYHTDTLRSKQTAEPLAAKLHITATEYSSAIPAQALPHWVDSVLSTQKGKRVVIVGHSGTVEPIVKKLSGAEVEPISGYDNLFIVVITDQQKPMVRLKYGAATN